MQLVNFVCGENMPGDNLLFREKAESKSGFFARKMSGTWYGPVADHFC